MATVGAYSRHAMFNEMNSPLFGQTPGVAGAVANVLSPDEQKARAMSNLVGLASMPTSIGTVTTSATTAAQVYQSSPKSGLIILSCTAFAMGTITDNAATGFGASLITFPTDTFVASEGLAGTLTVSAADRTTLVEVGLGTTVATGAVSVLSGTAAFENILGGTNSSAFSSSVATIIAPGVTTVNAQSRDYVALRTTTPGLVVFLNAAGAAQDVAANVTCSFTGKIALRYNQLV